MNTVKSYMSRNFQQIFINKVYTHYQIRLDLSDTDIYYLTLNDSTTGRTLFTLSALNEYYPQILNYKNQDAVNIVKYIIRLRPLCPKRRDLWYIISQCKHSGMHHSLFHRFLTTIGNIGNINSIECDNMIESIIYMIDIGNNVTNILSMVEKTPVHELLSRIVYLRNIQDVAKKSCNINCRIPVYLYEADIRYLSACSHMSGFIPSLDIFISLGKLMHARNYDVHTICARTTLLRSLHESRLLDSEAITNIFVKSYKLVNDKRDCVHIEAGNLAYCMIVYLNTYKMLTPSVLYSIMDTVELSLTNEGATTPEDIVGGKIQQNVLNPIVKEIKGSDLYNSSHDWTKLVSLDVDVYF